MMNALRADDDPIAGQHDEAGRARRQPVDVRSDDAVVPGEQRVDGHPVEDVPAAGVDPHVQRAGADLLQQRGDRAAGDALIEPSAATDAPVDHDLCRGVGRRARCHRQAGNLQRVVERRGQSLVAHLHREVHRGGERVENLAPSLVHFCLRFTTRHRQWLPYSSPTHLMYDLPPG
jgi:hypothetical protein